MKIYELSPMGEKVFTEKRLLLSGTMGAKRFIVMVLPSLRKPPPGSWLNCGTVGAQRQEDTLTLFAV